MSIVSSPGRLIGPANNENEVSSMTPFSTHKGGKSLIVLSHKKTTAKLSSLADATNTATNASSTRPRRALGDISNRKGASGANNKYQNNVDMDESAFSFHKITTNATPFKPHSSNADPKKTTSKPSVPIASSRLTVPEDLPQDVKKPRPSTKSVSFALDVLEIKETVQPAQQPKQHIQAQQESNALNVDVAFVPDLPPTKLKLALLSRTPAHGEDDDGSVSDIEMPAGRTWEQQREYLRGLEDYDDDCSECSLTNDMKDFVAQEAIRQEKNMSDFYGLNIDDLSSPVMSPETLAQLEKDDAEVFTKYDFDFGTFMNLAREA
jgi:hypothetical protein